MPHLGTVWKGIRIVAEVKKQEHTLESAGTEANIQEWELGFSSLNPTVGQPRRHDVWCVLKKKVKGLFIVEIALSLSS